MGFGQLLRSLLLASSSDASADSRPEAARLARLLVTEIRLYREADIDASIRDGVLTASMAEDLRRSYALFCDRTAHEPAVRRVFRDELVRQLFPRNEELLTGFFAGLE